MAWPFLEATKKLNSQTHRIGNDHYGKHFESAIEDLVPKTVQGRAGKLTQSQEMLMTHIKNSKQQRRYHGQNHKEHGPLKVDACLDVGASTTHPVRGEKEGRETVKKGVKLRIFPAFLEVRAQLQYFLF